MTAEEMLHSGELYLPTDDALTAQQQRCMEQLYASLQLSARAYHRILRVARTIADLEGAEEIGVPHLMEASFYRPSTEYWGH